MLPCSSSYSATIRTGVLAWKNWRSRLSNHNDFWKQKIFGQFSFATVENFKTVWSNLTSQETALNLWTFFLLLPKNWLIIFFSEIGPQRFSQKVLGSGLSLSTWALERWDCQIVICVVSVHLFFVCQLCKCCHVTTHDQKTVKSF